MPNVMISLLLGTKGISGSIKATSFLLPFIVSISPTSDKQESILPNFDFFVFTIFAFKLGHFKVHYFKMAKLKSENFHMLQTLKLSMKNRINLHFRKKKS